MQKGMLLLLGLGMLLSGCSGESAAKDADAPPEAAVYGMSASQVEWDVCPLPEEEILAAYAQAVKVYSWFETTPLPNSGEAVTVDGVLYHKVDKEGLSEMASLRAYLRCVFSRELTDELLESGGEVHYRDIDGVLYITGEGREHDASKGKTEIQVQQTGEASYLVNVTVELLDADGVAAGLECWSFPYAFDEDRWVFSDFQLVN